MSNPRIIVSLDFEKAATALELCALLEPEKCRVKVGKELFTRAGPEIIRQLKAMGFDIFLDLKYHDIPNTVAGACTAAAELGVWMLNVHAIGGRAMLCAAREAIAGFSERPLLVAVTVLTSLSEPDLEETGIRGPLDEQVLRMARLSRDCGLDGIVCSAREVSSMRENIGTDFCLVTPGIRPADSSQDDQKRTMTPAQAIRHGSDFIVIGRPITRAPDPHQALLDIDAEIADISR